MFCYLLELFVEEQKLSLTDQEEVGVVSDINRRVMCCVWLKRVSSVSYWTEWLKIEGKEKRER